MALEREYIAGIGFCSSRAAAIQRCLISAAVGEVTMISKMLHPLQKHIQRHS